MSRRTPSAKTPPATTYRLKIVLMDVQPAIWRRLLVRADMNLGLLHAVIQVAMEWLGGPFDPEAFDLDRINKYLRKLKWPRTTMAQLARVLMQRDGIEG